MKILIGSIIVIIIAAILTWFAFSVLFKPIGKIIKNQTGSFKEKMEEIDEDEQV